MADIYTDPDRLRRPVKRVGEGADAEWVEIGWDEALDLVADKLAETIEQHGRNAVGVYLGNPTAHSLGSATHGVAMVKSLRTRNRFSASSVDQIPHQFVGWQLYGHQLLLPVPDIDRTSYFLVFGANPMASNGSLMTVPDFPNRVRDLKSRGGRMVVIDPRRTETAKVATDHHFVRPGTDAVVLLAMLNVLFEEGLTTAPEYADHVDRVAELVADFTPERAEPVSGVPAAVIRQLTREFAAADGAAAYGRIGVSTHGFGSICQWAIQLLNLLTGNFDREGGVLFPEPAIDVVGRRIIGQGHFDVWQSRVRGREGVRRRAAGRDPVGGDRDPGRGADPRDADQRRQPRAVDPGREAARRGARRPRLHGLDRHLRQRDHPPRRRDPAAHLGPRARPVRPGLPQPRGAQHRPLHPGGLRQGQGPAPRLADLRRADLPAAGPDWGPSCPLKARLMAKARMAMSPATLLVGLLYTGRRTTMLQLRAHPEGVDLGPLKPTMPERLQTKGKRIDLAPELVVSDLDRLRESLAQGSPTTPDELLLIGRRHKQDCNSWMHNTPRLTRGKPRHHLLMHPDDLAARGITEGGRVVVTSRVGKVEVEATGVDDMMPGVVSLPHGYGHQVAGTRTAHASTVAGVSINDLTDPERLDVSGNAALNGVPVTVVPA